MSSPFDRLTTLDAPKFVDPTLMGVAALYTRAGYAPATVVAISINYLGPQTVESDGNASVIDDQPACLIVATDAPNAAWGDKLVISGVSYYIQSVRADDAGHLIISLTDTLQEPLPCYSLTTTYPGAGMSVFLSWLLPADTTRTAIEVWREAAAGGRVRVVTLASTSDSTTDTAPGEGDFSYTVVPTNPAGPGPPSAPLEVSVNA